MESNIAVGQRIAKAREFLGLTQAVVAERMGLARTTQVAIEQGQRPVDVAELYRYAEILSRPLDYFLGVGVWREDTDFRPHFRYMAERLDALAQGPPRRPGRPRGPAEAAPEKLVLTEFEALCRNYLELEEINQLPRPTMPELPVPKRHSVQEAEQLAATVRAHLGIGDDAPIRDLRGQLEDAFALRVFVLQPQGRLAAAAFHHPKVGACALMAERRIPQMRFNLAQTLGHLLANREQAMVDVTDGTKRTPLQTFAASFAGALLMPARAVRERFGALHSEANDVNDVALLFLARTFGVSVVALRSRLESLRLVSSATLKRLDESMQKRGAMPSEPSRAQSAIRHWEMLPERYVFLAIRAYRKELIDNKRLAEFLRTSEDQTALQVLLYVGSVAGGEGDGADPGT